MDVWVCEECTKHSTLKVCCCTNPPRPVCQTCFPGHSRRVQGNIHSLTSAEILDEPNIQEALLRMQHKIIELNTTKSVLRRNEQTLRNVIEEFKTEIDQLLANITAMKEKTIQALQKMADSLSDNLDPTIDKLKEYAASRHYKPLTPFEQLVWACDQSLLELVKPDWRKSFEELKNAEVIEVSALLRYPHLFTPVHETSLAVLYKGALGVFNCASETWESRVVLQQELPALGYWHVFFPNGLLLQCGGTANSMCLPTAFEITPDTGKVTQLESMTSPRKEHSGILLGEHIYVFGGMDNRGKLKSAERFSLQQRKWQAIGNMIYARLCFNPMAYNNMIYLIGGMERTYECYDPETQTFTEVTNLTLMEPSPTMTYWKSTQELIVLTSTYVHEINITTTPKENFRAGSFVTTTMTPLVFNNKVYAAGVGGVKFARLLLTEDPVSSFM